MLGWMILRIGVGIQMPGCGEGAEIVGATPYTCSISKPPTTGKPPAVNEWFLTLNVYKISHGPTSSAFAGPDTSS